jgi:lipopolysaccharide export system permease protein
MEWEVRNRIAAFLLQDGVFTPLSNGLTVYVRSREPDGTLKGVMIDDQRNPQDHSTIFARSGRLVQTPTGPEVILNDGSRQQVDYKTGRLNILTFKENVLDLSDGSQSAARTHDMTEMSVGALLDDQPPNPRDAPRWRAEAYKRLTAPLTALSYTMVALVAALTGSFKRHGSILRPTVAVLVMVGLIAFQLVAGDMAARNNAWIPLLWIQAIVPGLVSAWILFAPMLAGWMPRAEPQPQMEGVAP